MKRITFCICVYSSPSCRFSASLIRNIDIFRTKKYFVDHRTANAIQLFVPIKRKFFGSFYFQNKSQQRRILQGLLDKYSYPYMCISLKWTWSSGQKPVYNVKILVLEQTTSVWTSFRFLQVNQWKRVGMASTNNV